MAWNEQTLEALEQEFPKASAEATRAAYQKAVESGLPVVKVQGGNLVEVSPEGTKILKPIEPGTPIQAGTYYTIR